MKVEEQCVVGRKGSELVWVQISHTQDVGCGRGIKKPIIIHSSLYSPPLSLYMTTYQETVTPLLPNIKPRDTIRR